jgi:ABC-type branched-subunit amino acid transport system substrate-binding protein
MRRALAVPAVALASALALAGCSTTASSGTHAKPKDLTTDFGVTRAEITLGALTEHSGPFKDLSSGVVHGQQLWVNETNARGGICGRKIKLEVRDDEDDVRKAKAEYAALEPTVLGFMQIAGSSVTTALSQSLLDNETTAVALSKSSELLGNPYVIIPASTYDIEMINGLSYLMEQGKIHEGDTVGQLWLDGDYGANGLRGAKYFAQRHHLTLRDAKVTAATTDMRAFVGAFAGSPRITAIALSTAPDQTASALTANQQLGLNVPMIGNGAAFSPQLLFGPAAGALGALSVLDSSVPFSAVAPRAEHVAVAYQQAGYLQLPNSGVPYGYAIGKIWGQWLKRACTNGDMSRSGIQEAILQSTNITTDGLVADLNFAKPGSPASREASVGVPDAALLGGLREVKPLFMAPDAQSYIAAHQTGD